MEVPLLVLATPMIDPPPIGWPVPMFDVGRDPNWPPPPWFACGNCPPEENAEALLFAGGLPVGPPLGFPPKPGLPLPDSPGLPLGFNPGLGAGMFTCASPKWTSRHSDSPVMGSLYLLRRKRMWLISSS